MIDDLESLEDEFMSVELSDLSIELTAARFLDIAGRTAALLRRSKSLKLAPKVRDRLGLLRRKVLIRHAGLPTAPY